jgi:hypothetical protein
MIEASQRIEAVLDGNDRVPSSGQRGAIQLPKGTIVFNDEHRAVSRVREGHANIVGGISSIPKDETNG